MTVAPTILTMMNRVNLMIALMCMGLLDQMSMCCVGVFMNRMTGACCMSQGDSGVMPSESGTEGSNIDENVAVSRRTSLDQPVNCVLDAACL